MRSTGGWRKPSSRRASPTRMADRRPSSPACASRTSRRPRPVFEDFGFLLLLLSNGIMIGLMYTLIALGFVLVYKATDAVNFAQGEFVMIAGLVVAGALDILRAPLWAAILIGLSAMVAFGFALERIILRGVGPATVGAGTRTLPLPIPDEPIVVGPLFIPPIQLLGALVSLAFLGGFGWFFLKSRKGIAMRAIADNQQVAMAMGINVERYFGLAWAMTG